MRMKLNVGMNEIPFAKEDQIPKDVFTLENRRSSLFREKAEGFMDSVRQSEIEICYLQRELEIRRRRKMAHADFMQKKMKNRANRARRR